MEIILIVMVAVFYAVVFIPQQRKAKALRQTLASLAEGDEVITTGGVFGAIAEVDGEVVWLEVAPDIELKVLRTAIAGKVPVDGDAERDDDVDADPNADDSLVDDEA